MISDSTYWQSTLAAHAELLNVKTRQRHWRAESRLKVEQAVMMSCYIVRKLAEAKHISEQKFSAPLPLRVYAATGKAVDALNRHRMDELYELDIANEISRPLSYIANQLIHSFFFVPVFKDRNILHGVAFNSDRSKSRELYMVKLRTLAEAFAACADSMLSGVTIFTVKNGRLEVVPQEDDA